MVAKYSFEVLNETSFVKLVCKKFDIEVNVKDKHNNKRKLYSGLKLLILLFRKYESKT